MMTFEFSSLFHSFPELYFILRIFGIDPAAATEDSSMSGLLKSDAKVGSSEEVSNGGHDRIPFTGVTSNFIFDGELLLYNLHK